MLKSFGVIVFISGQDSIHESVIVAIFVRQGVPDAIDVLHEVLKLLFFLMQEPLRHGVDETLVGSLLRIPHEQVLIAKLHVKHFAKDKALSVNLIQGWQSMLNCMHVHLSDLNYQKELRLDLFATILACLPD